MENEVCPNCKSKNTYFNGVNMCYECISCQYEWFPENPKKLSKDELEKVRNEIKKEDANCVF